MSIIYVSPDNKVALVVIEKVFDRVRPGDSAGHYYQALDLDRLTDIPTGMVLTHEEKNRYCELQGDLVDRPYTPAPHTVMKFQHGNPSEYGFNGLTNELAIAATLHRLLQQNEICSNEHNEEAIKHLKSALVALEKRHRAVHAGE